MDVTGRTDVNRGPAVPVSYIVPAYECASTIEDAVRSILEGNLAGDDEIVVVDDGSSDGTARVLERLAGADGRVRVVSHAENRGGGAARNTAVRAARHGLIFCLDSDNVLFPGSVRALRRALAERGADAAVFQDVRFFRRDPSRVSHLWRFRPGWISLADHLGGAPVPAADGNYLYTRASWERAGGYPEFARALDAWGFGFRQAATGARIFVVEGTAYAHRFGHGSYWEREDDRLRNTQHAKRILAPFLHLLNEEDAQYLQDAEASRYWFSRKSARPLRLRNPAPPQPKEAPGRVVSLSLGHLARRTVFGLCRRLRA